MAPIHQRFLALLPPGAHNLDADEVALRQWFTHLPDVHQLAVRLTGDQRAAGPRSASSIVRAAVCRPCGNRPGTGSLKCARWVT